MSNVDPYAPVQNADGSWSSPDAVRYEGYTGDENRTMGSPDPNRPMGAGGTDPYHPTSGSYWGPNATLGTPNYKYLYDDYLAQYSTGLSQFDSRADELAAMRARMAGGYGQSAGLARQGTDIALRRLGLKEQGNLYDIDLARAQSGFVDEGLGIAREQHGSNRTYLDKLRGFAGRDYAMAGRQRSLADMGTQLTYDRDLWNANSDATARGAFGSEGVNKQRGFIGQTRDIGLGQNALGYDRATLDYDRESSSIDKQSADLDFDLRNTELTAKEKKATIDNRLKNMDLLAQDFGLQREELMNSLKQGLNNIGLQSASALAQIADAMSSNDANRQSAALQVAQAALNAANSAIASGTVAPGYNAPGYYRPK
jgi:hypothetical protein